MADQLILTGGGPQPDGVLIGKATTEKVGFHGATPIVQRASANGAALAAATYAAPEAGAVNTGDAGSDTVITSLRTQLIALAADHAATVVLVTELRATLLAYGLHKGAA